MTLVLRLIMNDGFSFDFSIACSEFFRVSWVNRCWSSSEVQQNVTTFNNKLRSCTWAKRIYVWRLLSSCRASLRFELTPRTEGLSMILGWTRGWPLHDIAMTNIVWYTLQQWKSGGNNLLRNRVGDNGVGGVPTQRRCLKRKLLMCAQKPRKETNIW